MREREECSIRSTLPEPASWYHEGERGFVCSNSSTSADFSKVGSMKNEMSKT